MLTGKHQIGIYSLLYLYCNNLPKNKLIVEKQWCFLKLPLLCSVFIKLSIFKELEALNGAKWFRCCSHHTRYGNYKYNNARDLELF